MLRIQSCSFFSSSQCNYILWSALSIAPFQTQYFSLRAMSSSINLCKTPDITHISLCTALMMCGSPPHGSWLYSISKLLLVILSQYVKIAPKLFMAVITLSSAFSSLSFSLLHLRRSHNEAVNLSVWSETVFISWIISLMFLLYTILSRRRHANSWKKSTSVW